MHVFGNLTTPMWCLKAKNSNSYCSSEGRYRWHKKVQLAAKKRSAWVQRISYKFFLLLTTPCVMFECKKLKFLLLIRRKIQMVQKNRASSQKTICQGLEDFVHVFGKLTTPYVMFESKKLKFLLLIRRKIQMAQKKYSQPLKKDTPRVQRILHVFLLLTTPYVMFESKKLKFLLFIKRKIQIAQKKYSQQPKKVSLVFRGFRMVFYC